MRIALTGVSGFIGSVIARRLRAEGHAVTGLVRTTSRRDHIEADVDRFVVGEHDDDRAWDALLDGADAVIHNSVDWAPLRDPVDLARHLQTNLVASIRLLHAAAPRPFVYMSTIAVHHDMRPRWNGVIDEDHPLRPGLLYGAFKAAVEPHLWQVHATGRPTYAIRPCGVYGLDPNLERSYGYPLLRKVAEGRAVDRPGGGKFVHVDDVAAATIACLSRPDLAGRPFNLVDCYARWADWGALAAEVLGVEVEIDRSSPASPKNTFTKDGAHDLGVEMSRGLDGIRAHLTDLAARMRERRVI